MSPPHRSHDLAGPNPFQYDSLCCGNQRTGAADEPVCRDIRRSPPHPKGGEIIEQMVARETVCLKRLGGDRGGEEAVGRFFANPRVTADKIIESWSEHTGPAAQGLHVL